MGKEQPSQSTTELSPHATRVLDVSPSGISVALGNGSPALYPDVTLLDTRTGQEQTGSVVAMFNPDEVGNSYAVVQLGATNSEDETKRSNPYEIVSGTLGEDGVFSLHERVTPNTEGGLFLKEEDTPLAGGVLGVPAVQITVEAAPKGSNYGVRVKGLGRKLTSLMLDGDADIVRRAETQASARGRHKEHKKSSKEYLVQWLWHHFFCLVVLQILLQALFTALRMQSNGQQSP